MQLQVSGELNNIINYAREEAMRTGSYGIGTDHLYLGVIRDAENKATTLSNRTPTFICTRSPSPARPRTC